MTKGCRTVSTPPVVSTTSASDGVCPSRLCRVCQERSVVAAAVVGTSGGGQVARGTLDHVAYVAQLLRHVRELLSRGGVAHVVVLQDHLQTARR